MDLLDLRAQQSHFRHGKLAGASWPRSKVGCALVLVAQLVVEVLADLLQDGRRYLRELDLAQLGLREVACGTPSPYLGGF